MTSQEESDRKRITDEVRRTSQYYLLQRDDFLGFKVIRSNIIGIDAAHQLLNRVKDRSQNPEDFQVLSKIEAEALLKGIHIGRRLGKRKKKRRLPPIYMGLE